MELFEKTGEALSGLWLAFDQRERLIVCAVGYLLFASLFGKAAKALEEREQDREQAATRRILAVVREELRHGVA